ncbi:hypothetical protein MKX03_001810, partial [Papaver bracteatum]
MGSKVKRIKNRTAGEEKTSNVLLKDCYLGKQPKKIDKTVDDKVEEVIARKSGNPFTKLPRLETMECFQTYKDTLEPATVEVLERYFEQSNSL